MDRLDVSTVVYVPRERAFEFLLDFPGYAGYTDFLQEVRQHGDGAPGTRYDLVLAWWKLTYTVTSQVTGVEPPSRIDWALEDFDVDGAWQVEEISDGELDGVRTEGCRIRLLASLDRSALANGGLDLPLFVSLDGVLNRIAPRVRDEVRTVLQAVVTDLEGEPRPVDLTVHEVPSFVDR